MGFWMTLSRHDAARVGALLDHPGGVRAGRRRLWDAWDAWDDPAEEAGAHEQAAPPVLEALEETHEIRRNWDGMHVLLTGCEDHYHEEDAQERACGPAPARDVVMGGLPLSGAAGPARIGVPVLLMPDEVRAVHGFLSGVDVPRLVRERAGLVEAAGVYSFRMTVQWADGSSRNMSMIEDGTLASALEAVRGFYARAAAAGNAVIKEIS
ncbi:DUF1877 family protein [Streptomyces sp. NPDC051211]|uniref:DUF1877 family protein n=1 Tax=Streptomyces sp. NPDC051211 TaxID=3154643 RepID=UPI00344F3B90